MLENNKIEIRASKFKLIFLLVVHAAFIVIFFQMLVGSSDSFRDSSLLAIPLVKNGLAILCLLIFGLCLFFVLKRLMNNEPVLIINDRGIAINQGTSWAKTFISWVDVARIEIAKKPIGYRGSQMKFLIIFLKNPEQWIQKQTNRFKQRSMRLAYKKYGSPVYLPTYTLKTKSDQLKNLLDTSFSKYSDHSQLAQADASAIIVKTPSFAKRMAKHIFSTILILAIFFFFSPDLVKDLKQTVQTYLQSLKNK